MSEGVALCRLSICDFAFDFQFVIGACDLEELRGVREIQREDLCSDDMTIHHQECRRYPSGGMGIISVFH